MKKMGILPISVNFEENGSMKKYKSILIGSLAGFAVLVFLPFLHFGIIAHIWDEFNYKVNKKDCTCSCWDTVFKGIYDRGPAGYKHIYFNATSNSLKIWFSTVIFILLVYEGTKRAIKLLLAGSVRYSMLILLCCSIYPHYYSFWSFFNYWNDEYYRQFNHQLYFTITELISTAAVIYLLDKNVNVTARRVLVIADIAILHVLASGFDQFIENIVRGNGKMHQVMRDIFFMVPDLLNITIPFIELHKHAKSKKVPAVYLISNVEFMTSVTFVLIGWLLSMVI
ncbi:UNVERIFIED_CONTAM: hypothetical protein RMT77_000228 [Armadillidium vulgare]